MNTTNPSQLPAYKSHKTVHAAKITAFRQNGNPDMPDLVLGEINGIVSLLPYWHQKHKPQVGGYFVQYEDGYQSYSPAKAFEEGYTLFEEKRPDAAIAIATKCSLCGEPMPEGETMFKFHGYSGNCPKPPLSAHQRRVVEQNDVAIEQEIQAKGLTAPRVTPADIEANIASEHYFTAHDGATAASEEIVNVWHDDKDCGTEKVALSLLTFCVLVLRNGFTVTGESACASPENFNADIGRKIARQNAVQKIWPLMGYELKERLSASADVKSEGGAQ